MSDQETGQPATDPSSDRIVRDAMVPADLAGIRADRVAAELLPEFSRAQLHRWMRAGCLTFDQRALVPKTRVAGGEALRLDAPEHVDRGAVAQAVDFTVCYEDDDLLVLDKPAGLVVHPGAGNPDHTLVNGLIAHRPGLASLPRAGLVHRLDKGTSGLLIAAGNEQAFKRLTEAMASRHIARRYLAVVEGVLTGGREIESPIGRDPRNRLKQRVHEQGRPASTRVRVRQRFRAHTLIEAQLGTGRTHQIRVHLSSVGFPLVGDRAYGSRGRLPRQPSERLLSTVRGFDRPALHAWQLEFDHPSTGDPLQFEVEAPADFADLLEALAADRNEQEQS